MLTGEQTVAPTMGAEDPAMDPAMEPTVDMEADLPPEGEGDVAAAAAGGEEVAARPAR